MGPGSSFPGLVLGQRGLLAWWCVGLDCESHRYACLSSSACNDITLVARNQLWWKYFHHRNRQCCTFSFREPVMKHLSKVSAQVGGLALWSFPSSSDNHLLSTPLLVQGIKVTLWLPGLTHWPPSVAFHKPSPHPCKSSLS